MKKASTWIAVIVVLAAVYIGGAWISGRMARQQVDRLTEYMTRESAGLLKVVERKSAPGFFRDVEDITFSVDYPLVTTALGSPGFKFTVHNIVQHGPLPGLRTIGIARVETTLVMDESTRKMLLERLGTDKPLDIAVTFGFTGNTAIDVDSPAMNVKTQDDPTTFTWKGMKSHTVYARNFTRIKVDVDIPGIAVDGKDGTHMVMDGLKFNGQFKKAFETLYVGDAMLSIGALDFNSSREGERESGKVNNAYYGVAMSTNEQFFNVSLKAGAGRMDTSELKVKDAHFNFSLNHLHAQTLDRIYKTLQDAARKMPDSAATAKVANEARNQQTDAPPPATEILDTTPPVLPQFNYSAVQADVLTLMKNDPELVIDNIGFATDHGDLKITASAKLLGATEQELNTMDINQLTKKLKVVADIAIAQDLAEHWPVATQQNFAAQLLQMESQGFMKRTGDRLESHIEFTNGKLSANGKSM